MDNSNERCDARACSKEAERTPHKADQVREAECMPRKANQVREAECTPRKPEHVREAERVPGVRRRKQSGHRARSLRWRMIGVLMICWLIPFAFLTGIFGVYLASNHSDMTAQNFRDQLEFNVQICVERLNGAIAASRQASYDGDLLATYAAYQDGRLSYVKASREYKEYLIAQYTKNNAVSCAILWFAGGEDPEAEAQELYGVYNEHGKGSYQQIRTYQESDHSAVRAYAESLGTRAGFLKRGRTLYLVRNLLDGRFQTRGTLVFGLNRDYCFNSLKEYPMADGVYTEVNGEALRLIPNERLDSWEAERRRSGSNASAQTAAETSGSSASAQTAAETGGDSAAGQSDGSLIKETQDQAEAKKGYVWLGDRLLVTDRQNGDNYALYTSMLLQKEVTRYPFYGYQYVLGAMLLCLIPMLLLMLYVFRRQVTDPIEALSDGARHIEHGELGYQVRETVQNAEFTYLRDSMNQMSANLKRQFDQIYQEEIALREARIMALQSHINPHFMNNTLEIINWEARLGGNEKVSKMIGALSTMLDAAMDRRRRSNVRLAEEMGYVNSYLYITKERLGKRLTVEIDLPGELMDCLVPRLILQPVIENAIEHGVVPNGSGTVWLRGYCDETYLYLETVNNGGMTDEDRRRVARLLDPAYQPGKEPAGNLGIANVNQRLRILYKEPCGLAISEDADGRVTAKLTIPKQKQETEAGEMNKKEQ